MKTPKSKRDGRRLGKQAQAASSSRTHEWTPFIRTGQTVPSLSTGTPEGVVWANNRYLVVVRTIQPAQTDTDVNTESTREKHGEPETLVWLSIKERENGTQHDWRDFQRIKNELVGVEVEAVELYPAESRLVDCANQYHLWCFPGFHFPFGFDTRHVADAGQHPNTKQRLRR